MNAYPPDRAIRTTRTSRADLIRLLKAGGGIGLDETAPLFGYARQKKPAKQTAQPAGQTVAGSPGPSPQEEHLFLEAKGEVKFWCLTEFENKDPGDIRTQAPEWAQKGNTLTQADSRAKQTFKMPVYLPLEKTSRIWPFIKAALGSLTATADLDMKKSRSLGRKVVPHGPAAHGNPFDLACQGLRRTGFSRPAHAFLAGYSADS